MRNIKELTDKDHIAFGFNYNGGKPTEIIVEKISEVMENGRFLVHFLWGYKSLGEFIEPDNVLAIGNIDGKYEIKGWSGKFDVFQPEHPLIVSDATPVE